MEGSKEQDGEPLHSTRASVSQGLEEQVKVSPKESEDFQVIRQAQIYVSKGLTEEVVQRTLTTKTSLQKGMRVLTRIAGGLYPGWSLISDKCHQELKDARGETDRTIKGIFQTQFFGPWLPQLANTISAKSMCSVVFSSSSKVL